ncbi:hypothetical protein C8F04DRAFT_1264929 [Mycena alexandri]|uniref:CxC2-like cysteine cluster KDZ transposase-associated domain-containing protein n=1 Tax=Mycena alexandri TaxID=1745969 RepID=A0AAD6SKT9_9AGAR|nr:hypothetical protein C8F04DRAFT_1264929 [Mycena alexandri]
MDKPPSCARIFQVIRALETEHPQPLDVPLICTSPGFYNDKPDLRCIDCFQAQFLCAPCMLISHQHNPLHRIQWWDNQEFTTSGLEAINMCINLGHGGRTCSTSVGDKKFCIIDGAGVHKIPVDFCGCPGAPSRAEQLLAARLYPQHRDPPHVAVAFSMAYTLDAPGGPGLTAARYLKKIS